jgi:hypothetical protein
MNESRCDKGSTYACAHCYTFVYETVFQELILRDQISMLEIGLNRDGYDEVPSLRGWRQYFGPKVTLYGMDIDPRFLRHHDPAAGIHILIGDQSSPADLVRCGIANAPGWHLRRRGSPLPADRRRCHGYARAHQTLERRDPSFHTSYLAG